MEELAAYISLEQEALRPQQVGSNLALWDAVCTWAQDERPADLHMAQPNVPVRQGIPGPPARLVRGTDAEIERERERATQRGRALTSSMGLWEGPFSVRITQCPYQTRMLYDTWRLARCMQACCLHREEAAGAKHVSSWK
jgi:hypothetical protein